MYAMYSRNIQEHIDPIEDDIRDLCGKANVLEKVRGVQDVSSCVIFPKFVVHKILKALVKC